MTTTRQVTVRVGTDGAVQVEADGFTGTSCVEATAALEEALGQQSDDRELKPAYHEEELNLEVNR